ncbi:MAG: SMI1/KNR4 family protein [Ruminococcus sp.]|nr:SMI1/KNR4 family protein [Ruminococcus sp.]
MISQELRTITETLRKQGTMRFFIPAVESQISAFEEKNGIRLPEKYRQWLKFSDGGECFLPAGVQFYGVAKEPLIGVDDGPRPDDSYVVIGALASGDPIMMKKGSETISIYNKDAGRIEPDEVYSDFFSFLRDLSGILGIGE